MTEQPIILTTESLRDFAASLPYRDRWVHLGPAFAPSRLVSRYARTVCDIYVLPLTAEPQSVDVPSEIAELNRHYFCTDFCGLSGRQAAWALDDVGMKHPTLCKIGPRDWREMYLPSPERQRWWVHPARRRYERLIVVPRG